MSNGTVAAVFYALGSFGPWISASIVLKVQGRSLKTWVVGLFKWQVHPLWYLFALGFPILLIAIVSLVYLLLGHVLDILHASYNAANGLLLLVPEEALRGSSYQSLLVLMTLVLGAPSLDCSSQQRVG
ncbi:MAG: hypothetical protein WA902_06870 [Thermosynechococcaceae cyanobacterium]